MPTVAWYRNGKLLKDGLVTNYAGQMLIINTYEERHKGIYQCFAQNVAGEAYVNGLLSWENKKSLERPKNVRCHPVNRTTLLVTFDGDDNYKVRSMVIDKKNILILYMSNCHSSGIKLSITPQAVQAIVSGQRSHWKAIVIKLKTNSF